MRADRECTTQIVPGYACSAVSLVYFPWAVGRINVAQSAIKNGGWRFTYPPYGSREINETATFGMFRLAFLDGTGRGCEISRWRVIGKFLLPVNLMFWSDKTFALFAF